MGRPDDRRDPLRIQGGDSAIASAPGAEHRARRGSRLATGVLVVVLALVGARLFLLEPFRIPSGSMAPTLQSGDRVLADKITSRAAHPRRGDLVVFARRGDAQGPSLKRVVGLPGDRIEIRNGVLSVNDRPIRERYVDYGQVESHFFGPRRVARGRVFVLGDNRDNSRDSRVFGDVAQRDLIGRGILRFWPPWRIAPL